MYVYIYICCIYMYKYMCMCICMYMYREIRHIYIYIYICTHTKHIHIISEATYACRCKPTVSYTGRLSLRRASAPFTYIQSMYMQPCGAQARVVPITFVSRAANATFGWYGNWMEWNGMESRPVSDVGEAEMGTE